MSYIGDFPSGVRIDHSFTTVDSTGLPTTITSGSAMVRRMSDAGIATGGISVLTSSGGLHRLTVFTGSGTVFYAVGNDYDIYLGNGTVAGVSVIGYKIGQFSLDNRGLLRPTVVQRTLDVSAGGEAGLDWANVGSPTTTVVLSGTTVSQTSSANIQFWRGSQPSVLQSGRVDAYAGALATGVVDTGAFAAGGIDAAALAADVTTELAAPLVTDTYAEPGQGAPAATATIVGKIGYLYKFLRNRITTTSSKIEVFNDDSTTVGQRSTHSDDGTTYDRGEFGTGA